MNKIARHVAWALSAALGLGLVGAAPAAAQATRSWVSGLGDDANPCSRTAPCKTFAAAISKTATSGEINCLDPASYGAVRIGKSITIRCDYTEAGILTTSGGTSVYIDAPGATVTLIGLDIEGMGQGSAPGGNGVDILNANVVQISNSRIRGFRAGRGIFFRPQNATVHLIVDNVALSESGTSNTGGIVVAPGTNASGVTARLTLTNSQITNSGPTGLRLDTGGQDNVKIIATVNNTTFSDDIVGVMLRAPAGTGTIQFLLANSLVTHNKATGVFVNGAPSLIGARVGNTTITANEAGIGLNGTSELYSIGDNILVGNKTDGAFTGTAIGRK
jgi:nitrous oxidase accessory protein NosD